jgi:hypothetical protein
MRKQMKNKLGKLTILSLVMTMALPFIIWELVQYDISMYQYMEWMIVMVVIGGIITVFLSCMASPYYKTLTCDHIYRYRGQGLFSISLLPKWIFACTECIKREDSTVGIFPNKEAYDFYKEASGDSFGTDWGYVVSQGLSHIKVEIPSLRNEA